MKRIIAVLILCFMLASVCTVGFAAEIADESEKILTLIKPRIPNTNEYSKFSSSVFDRNDDKEYIFRWNDTSETDNRHKYMNVTANAFGIITSFHIYDSEQYSSNKIEPAFKAITSDEAMAKAKEAVDALNPALSESIEISKSNKYESLTDNSFSFKLQRVENGIPVYGNTGSVTIDSASFAISHFNLSFTTGLEFPAKTQFISPQEAVGAYDEKLGMELVYKTSYSSDSPAPYLAYVPKVTDSFISATTAEAVKPILPVSDLFRAPMADKEAAVGGAGSNSSAESLSEAELSELESLSKLIPVAEAEEAVRANKYIAVPGDAPLAGSSAYSHSDGKYYYELQFQNVVSPYEYICVKLNAQNGEIVTVSKMTGKLSDEETVDLSDAYKIAASLAPSYCKADGTGEYRFTSRTNNSFTLTRYINDVPYYSDSINLTVNDVGNTIVYYSISRSDYDFPKPESVITPTDAIKKLVEQVEYSVVFYPSCSKEEMKKADTALPVYMLEFSKNHEVDAITGKLVSHYSEPEIGGYTDISGHYAEEKIKTLASYGIGFEGEHFNPDSLITQKEYVALLADAVMYRDPIIIYSDLDYSNHYRRAKAEGILADGEENPDGAVTRQAAALYFVRAIGYDEVASYDWIFKPTFVDVTENIGHISILDAMGVVSGYEGYFNPERNLTRADAAIMIYNYLSR